MNAILKDIVSGIDGVDMVCCTWVIKNEIEQGLTLGDIAVSYSLAIRSEASRADKPNWREINEAILARFGSKGLQKIKELAWKRLERPKP